MVVCLDVCIKARSVIHRRLEAHRDPSAGAYMNLELGILKGGQAELSPSARLTTAEIRLTEERLSRPMWPRASALYRSVPAGCVCACVCVSTEPSVCAVINSRTQTR